MNKIDYAAEMRRFEERARKDGYDEKDIKRAYEISRLMGRSYLSEYTLKRAKEENENKHQ